MPATGERKDTIEQIALKDLRESPFNLRKQFDATSLAELAQSIQAQGVIQPLLARPLNDGLAYEIVAGARRFRAAKLAGLKNVPCLVRNLNEEQARTEQILENLQRQDITALEEASGFQELLKANKGFAGEDGAKNQSAVMALAHSIGKSKEYVYARLKLLKLDARAQQSLAAGKLNPSQAVELVPLTPDQQKTIVRLIEAPTSHIATVQDVRQEIKHRFAPKPAPPKMSAAEQARAKRRPAADQKSRQWYQKQNAEFQRKSELQKAALLLAATPAWKKLSRLTKKQTGWYLRRVLVQAGTQWPGVFEACCVAAGKPVTQYNHARLHQEVQRATATGQIVPVLALSLIWSRLCFRPTPEGVALLRRLGVNWKACQKQAAADAKAAHAKAVATKAAPTLQTSAKTRNAAAQLSTSKHGRKPIRKK